MAQHPNMFDYLETKKEVYSKLQTDFARDEQRMQWAQLAAGVLVSTAFSMHDSGWSKLLFYFAGAAAFIALHLYIDVSNRNSALHVIDWIEATLERQSRLPVKADEAN